MGDNHTDGGHQYAVANYLNQLFVDAVRSAGGKNRKRYLGIPSYSANIGLTIEHLKMPVDRAKGR